MLKIEFEDLSVKISHEVILRMYQFIQDDKNKPESGGILIGHDLQDNNFSITDISTPSIYDKSNRFNFTRSKKNAQLILNKFFKESNGKKIYLGEWHTHPEDYPTPSTVDKKSILERIHKDVLNSEIIFMIIVGRKSFYISYVKMDGIKKEKNISFKDIDTSTQKTDDKK